MFYANRGLRVMMIVLLLSPALPHLGGDWILELDYVTSVRGTRALLGGKMKPLFLVHRGKVNPSGPFWAGRGKIQKSLVLALSSSLTQGKRDHRRRGRLKQVHCTLLRSCVCVCVCVCFHTCPRGFKFKIIRGCWCSRKVSFMAGR